MIFLLFIVGLSTPNRDGITFLLATILISSAVLDWSLTKLSVTDSSNKNRLLTGFLLSCGVALFMTTSLNLWLKLLIIVSSHIGSIFLILLVKEGGEYFGRSF